MSDIVGPFEVERDLSSGEHLVTVYVDTRHAGIRLQGGLLIMDLTAHEAEHLAQAMLHCATDVTPVEPAGPDPDAAYDRMREERDGF